MSQRGVYVQEGDFWGQFITDNETVIYRQLHDKIAYAKSRWNVKIYYIDSNVWVNGGTLPYDIFRKLKEDFPDTLLIPEWETQSYWGATAPYNQANMGVYGTWPAARIMYPDGFSVIVTNDIDYTAHRSKLVESVRQGDILTMDAWWDPPVNAEVDRIYQEAASVRREDINGDGTIDILDVHLALSRFGEGAALDVTGDGKTNILDIMQIIRQFD
jgi:hypothetical protein